VNLPLPDLHYLNRLMEVIKNELGNLNKNYYYSIVFPTADNNKIVCDISEEINKHIDERAHFKNMPYIICNLKIPKLAFTKKKNIENNSHL
jgi:hypothetical protein